MKVFSTNYKCYIFIFLFLSVYCAIEEGNILIPMTSNFTIEHSESKINNKNYYTIPLFVGTPEEEYNVQIDTSSATSWIPSSHCINCILSHRLYEEEDSRTCSPTNILIEIEDEDGNVEGYQTSDNILLGNYKLKQYGFVQVTKVADNFRDHYQGKLGLGYKSHYLKDEEFNFLEKLKKHNLIKKKIFTINAINEKKGMLFIGDIPGKEYQSYCNVTDTDQLDDMYKESWVCQLTHVGVFDKNAEGLEKINSYEELKNNKFVSFDSAYDYIAVPISEKEHIEKLLDQAGLDCKERKKSQSTAKAEDKLRNKIREEEITITCKEDIENIKETNLTLSFVLQGHAYTLPIELLFTKTSKENEVEMLIKYIDDENAIWTFGYPFMNQFLMIFDMDDKHVGFKKLKKTAFPIINIDNKDWLKYNLKEESSDSCSAFKIIGYITLIIVVAAVIFFIYHAIRKGSISNKIGEMNPNTLY